ncbi:MAG: hypothetical protein ABIJ61_13895, partial [bacterium]
LSSKAMSGRRSSKKNGRLAPPRGVRLERKERNAPRYETRAGFLVRSKLEQQCADWLAEQGITLQYEPLILLAGRQYRPDFFLPRHELFIEICGYRHMPFYTDRQEEKRRLYERHRLQVLFIDASRAAEAIRKLKTALSEAGILPPEPE